MNVLKQLSENQALNKEVLSLEMGLTSTTILNYFKDHKFLTLGSIEKLILSKKIDEKDLIRLINDWMNNLAKIK